MRGPPRHTRRPFLKSCLICGVLLITVLYAVLTYFRRFEDPKFQKEVFGREYDRSGQVILESHRNVTTTRGTRMEVEVLSWYPRILRYSGFLTTEECKSLRDGAAQVLDGTIDPYDEEKLPGVEQLEQKLALGVVMPINNFEPPAFERYRTGEKKTELRRNYILPALNIREDATEQELFLSELRHGLQRHATYYMFVTETEVSLQGKDPVVGAAQKDTSHFGLLFPKVKPKGRSESALMFKPLLGDVLLVYNADGHGNMEPRAKFHVVPPLSGDDQTMVVRHVRDFEYDAVEGSLDLEKELARFVAPDPVFTAPKGDGKSEEENEDPRVLKWQKQTTQTRSKTKKSYKIKKNGKIKG